MKIQLIIFTLTFLSLSSFAQEVDIHVYDNSPVKKSQLSIYFGWNRGFFSNSTIHFKGTDYDFTLFDLKAKDKQTVFSIKEYFNLSKLTIPQTNMGAIYQISDKTALSLNVDHMKYVVERGQETSIEGTISSKYGVLNGTYENEDITLSNNLLKLEHTDGLNYINFGYRRLLWEKSFLTHFGISIQSGGSAGFLLPKTNSELLGKERNDEFHLSGYGVGLNSGVRLHIGKPLFIAFNGKGGFINMPNVRTTPDKNDKASQHFFFLQSNFLFGITIKLSSIKKPFN